MTEKKYKYWLAVEDGQTVRFSDLAHMMATALHPEGGMAYAAACNNLEDELKLAVRDGLLRVRNPAGLGLHTFPHGDALQRAVLFPGTDLEPFLNARGIELRVTQHGSGPVYWTLENAAASIQEQLNWHDGTCADFLDQMQDAAQSGALVVINPRTCLPYRPETVRTFWEYVTPDNVNAWLAVLKAPYRWSPEPSLVTVPKKPPRDFKPWEKLVPFYEPIPGLYMYQQAAREISDAEGWDDSKLEALEAEMIKAINDRSLPIRCRKTGMVTSPESWQSLMLVTVDDVNEWLEGKRVPYRWKLQANTPQPPSKQKTENKWKSAAQSRAHEIISEARANDRYPSQESISDQIAREFRAAGNFGADGKPISGGYIKRHALKGITSAIGKKLSTTKQRGK